ncbi:hypothetical protein BGW37DRAFT_546541 [Umbelopsis sp. PMI_123]|nr:hypothetical protein BGW37DRAFT_546541 [Umbelopsis sp. PMI_123]
MSNGVSGTDLEHIVYLEPNANSPLAKSANSFLQRHQTTASRYECHCSMTGFFRCDSVERAADLLGDCIQGDLGHVQVKHGLIAKETPHLLLPVQAPRPYHAVIELFVHKMASQQDVKVRPKRIDHISLAYHDEPNGQLEWTRAVNNGLLIRMQEEAATTIELSGATSWNIVLLERTSKGSGQGEKHGFRKIRQWNNVDHTHSANF